MNAEVVAWILVVLLCILNVVQRYFIKSLIKSAREASDGWAESNRMWAEDVGLSFPNLVPVPDYANVFTVNEFMEAVEQGLFIPYDGTGYYATEKAMDRSYNVWDSPKPKWATHVAWFNK